jgi:ABC-2 type transport system permease protein
VRAKNLLHLGIKELWSLARDPIMLLLIVFAFTMSVYSTASSLPDTLYQAPIAIVDEDQSVLSQRIIDAFQPPLFMPPRMVSREEMDTRMDAGLDTFALNIPPNFQQDVLAGRSPRIQLNTDATRVSQAFSGSGYVQTIVTGEVQTFSQRYRSTPTTPVVEIQDRVRFNANLTRSWFGGVVGLIDMITMLSVLLTGSALIRERERGTVEHLLVMPVTPAEIMTSKVWSMGLVVLVASTVSMRFVVQGWLGIPIQGSVPLFLCGAALHVFAVTSLGMFLATFARTMPQFSLLMIMVLLPLSMLDGGMTARESMPEWVQRIMLAAPTTHFVMLGQGILFRGGGIEVVWPQFLALAVIGTVLFGVALARFRKTIGSMT